MDFSLFAEDIVSFYYANKLIALAVGLIFIYLLVRKTKLFFLLFMLALFLAGVFYMISSVATTGVSQKKKMIRTDDEKAGGRPALKGMKGKIL